MRRWSSKKGQGEAYGWLTAHVGHAGAECLIWPFHRDAMKGYGTLGHNGGLYKAHRLMCELVNGKAPSPKHHAAHSCGNGHLGCVNPRHLSWKTPHGNARDRVRHGNNDGNRFGSRTALPARAVADMQTKKQTQMQYAEKYGISRSAVQYWQYKDRLPVPHSTSPQAVRRRQSKLFSAS